MKANELLKKAQDKAQSPINKAEIPKEQGEVKQKQIRQPSRTSLLGEMISKEKNVVYDKKSEYYRSTFYKIKTRNIENMENDAPAIIYAFKETIINPKEAENEGELKRKSEIWRIIERDEYLGKRWIIYCFKTSKGYKIYDLLERPK